jgi:hypothetical protein
VLSRIPDAEVRFVGKTPTTNLICHLNLPC